METPLRILVAEDELGDVLMLQLAFQHAGISAPVHFASDGQEVVDYMQGNPPFENPVQHPLPNLLLLDLKLPCLDGFEVLTWIRRQPGLHRLVVVVLTGSEHPEDIQRAYALGANAYVVKPHKPDELIHIVGRLQNYWLGIDALPQTASAGLVRLAG